MRGANVFMQLWTFLCARREASSTSFWMSDTIWNLPQSYTEAFGYVLSGFVLRQHKAEKNTTATHDEIYDFLFNLPCLLQRLVDETILFSLFLLCRALPSAAMRLVGGFFCAPLYTD